MLVGVGMAAGLGLAYLDSLPTWDDSGILAGGMLLTSAALTLAGGQPAWLMALSIGIWIPGRAIIAGADPLIAAVALFAFVGAYAGGAMRAGIARPANSE